MVERADAIFYGGAGREGSAALSLCTTARPLHTRFTNIFVASISEATMRPNPRRAVRPAAVLPLRRLRPVRHRGAALEDRLDPFRPGPNGSKPCRAARDRSRLR